jgi:glycosyltransferase involved in cell wall biosynthesis
MIIGIDITSIPYGTGVSNYTLNLVHNLIRIDKKNTYKLFFSSLRLKCPKEIDALKSYPNVKIYYFRFPLTFLELIWNRLHILPIELFIGKCDVFHTSDWTQPPTIFAKTITTVHDLTPFLHPKWHHPKVIKAHHNKMFWAIRRCFAIICVSNNTKNDLLKLFPKVDINKISVIYEAAENKYDKFLKLSTDIQSQKKDVIRKQYGLNKFILAQGTREPRKNLERLIRAFNIFRESFPKSKIELAIAGKYGWGEDIKHLKNCYVKILGYIPEKDMVALHASAICLAYPSLYEGFGLPLIKSMKVGTPIITSNISSLPEITNGCALLIDPESPEDIANALKRITRSSNLRKKMIQKGIKQAKIFSWTKTAQQTLNLYQNAK